MKFEKWNTQNSYINEIIRITYKCNWSCKFCNVIKTNNFWEIDVTDKEIIYQILNLTRKYTLTQRKELILSFSGWEPTLNKNLIKYIKLAKRIWVATVEIQTNGTILFKNHTYILDLIDAGLDEIFLAQHSADEQVNKELWSFFKIDDFINWTRYILENSIQKKIDISLNIVVSSINLSSLYEYLQFLIKIDFVKIVPDRWSISEWKWYKGLWTREICFGYVQPNWYAEINREKVLLKYTESEVKEIDKIMKLCKENDILPDLHFVCPPLCIINYPEYNFEYEKLKKLEEDNTQWTVNRANLKTYKLLWREKEKFKECENCKYDKYCLWFYKNWIEFVWKEYAKEKVTNFTSKSN